MGRGAARPGGGAPKYVPRRFLSPERFSKLRNVSLRAKKEKNRYWCYLFLTSIATSSAEIAKNASNAGVPGVAVGTTVVAIGVGITVVGTGVEITVVSINLYKPPLP